MAILLALVPVALAHGAGSSFEKRVGNKLVDVGCDPAFKVGEETLLDFAVYEMEGEKVLGLSTFTKVRASFESGSLILWETVIDKPDFGKVFATVTPIRPGNWNFVVTFGDSSDSAIATAAFPVRIEPSDADPASMSSTMFAITILASAALLIGILRKFLS